MSDECKIRVWPWIVALLIGLPVLYVASFGPACWACSRLDDRHPDWEVWNLVQSGYWPVICAACGDARIKDAAQWYAALMSTQPVHFTTWGDGRPIFIAGHLWSG